MDLTRKHTPSIGLRQYRVEDAPILGDFALGLLTEDSDRWGADGWLSDTCIEAELKTPWGGLYGWYRRW